MKVMGNDLSRGLFPAKEVKLLVVDEAHKAQGDYAYCQVARLLCRNLIYDSIRSKLESLKGIEQSRSKNPDCCSERHSWRRRAQREAGVAESFHFQD